MAPFVFFIVVFHFMKIIHVELLYRIKILIMWLFSKKKITYRTNEAKLLVLKYLGNIFSAN